MAEQATRKPEARLLQGFTELTESRRSVRAFLPEPVSEPVLEAAFALAQRAPSNCNTQPWQVHVVSGEARDRLSKRLREAFLAGDLRPDYPYEGRYAGVFKERQHDAARQLYRVLDIAREDREAREAAFLRNFDFFDAPHVALLFLPSEFGIREAADLGMYAQNLMLSLGAHGIASCPQTSLGFLAEQVREELAIDAEQKLLFGISFGYEDENHPVNACRVGRAPLSQAVRFHS